MNNSTTSSATADFEVAYQEFAPQRERVQELFEASRFEQAEKAWRDSGSQLDLDGWLLHEYHSGDDISFWRIDDRRTEYFGEHGIWNKLYIDGYFNNGRQNFVKRFNKLLEAKGMRARLGDNGVQMYFIDVSRYRER